MLPWFEQLLPLIVNLIVSDNSLVVILGSLPPSLPLSILKCHQGCCVASENFPWANHKGLQVIFIISGYLCPAKLINENSDYIFFSGPWKIHLRPLLMKWPQVRNCG